MADSLLRTDYRRIIATKHKTLGGRIMLGDNSILSHQIGQSNNGQNIPVEQVNTFVARQVTHYTEEIEALEAELKTAKVLLYAYQSWYQQLIKQNEAGR